MKDETKGDGDLNDHWMLLQNSRAGFIFCVLGNGNVFGDWLRGGIESLDSNDTKIAAKIIGTRCKIRSVLLETLIV